MDEESGAASRYFCHMCSLIIRPELGIEEVKCPHCHTGFVEEMTADDDDDDAGRAAAAAAAAAGEARAGVHNASSDNAALEREVSLWAPVLMDFIAASSARHGLDGLDATAAGDLAALARRQYRNIALLQLLNALHEGSDANANTDRERVVLMSPTDARAMLMGGRGQAGRGGGGGGEGGAGGLTLGDLFLGPGLDLLLEYLAETDPSRQGTPPARKEAVAALPTVRVREGEAFTCPVCLDEVAGGGEAREMPCRHRFHEHCILPWLEMHSSCPVCRHQLPTDQPLEAAAGRGAGAESSGNARGGDGGSGSSSGRRHWFSWPFGAGGLFSQRSNGNSPSSSS